MIIYTVFRFESIFFWRRDFRKGRGDLELDRRQYDVEGLSPACSVGNGDPAGAAGGRADSPAERRSATSRDGGAAAVHISIPAVGLSRSPVPDVLYRSRPCPSVAGQNPATRGREPRPPTPAAARAPRRPMPPSPSCGSGKRKSESWSRWGEPTDAP